MKKKELDNILDQITDGIRAEQVDDATVSGATERVWARLSTETGARKMRANRPQDAGAPASTTIEGCADFQSLIPAYLGGELSEARSLLLVDHSLPQGLEAGARVPRWGVCSVAQAESQGCDLQPAAGGFALGDCGCTGHRVGSDRAALDSAVCAVRIV